MEKSTTDIKYQKLIIGSRGSKLALVQANAIMQKLREAPLPVREEIEIVQTSADRHQDKKLAEIGGKGLFVKELEEALLARKIDLAVHSLKDVPGILPDDFCLAAFCGGEARYDVFLSNKGSTLKKLPRQSVVGTSSPRRRVQLLALRPDLKTKEIRGNVETRLHKLEAGEVDGLLLAAAGLNRLGLKVSGEALDPKSFLPAVGQGILALEVLREREDLISRLRRVFSDKTTEAVALAERAFLAGLGGNCYSPIAAHAYVEGDRLCLIGWMSTTDGKKQIRKITSGPKREAERLGSELAKEILKLCTSC